MDDKPLDTPLSPSKTVAFAPVNVPENKVPNEKPPEKVTQPIFEEEKITPTLS